VENDRRALSSPGDDRVIETLVHGDGTTHHAIVSKFPVPGPDGRAALIGGMAIDIPERLQAEDALRTADRNKDEFLAMLGHELRNPLAGILNGIEVLNAVGNAVDDAVEMRAIITRQAAHMNRLVDDLLDMTRITRGKITLKKSRIDLVAL